MKIDNNLPIYFTSILFVVFSTVSLFNFLMTIRPIENHALEALFYFIMACFALVLLVITIRLTKPPNKTETAEEDDPCFRQVRHSFTAEPDEYPDNICPSCEAELVICPDCKKKICPVCKPLLM